MARLSRLPPGVREISLSPAVVPDESLYLPAMGEDGAKRRKGAVLKQNGQAMNNDGGGGQHCREAIWAQTVNYGVS